MKLALSVEALAPQLTGIGRYTWELAQHLPQGNGVESLRFFRSGRWIADPSTLLEECNGEKRGPARPRMRLKMKMPRWMRELKLKLECRGRLFHGPNYFLPPCADLGVVTIHDLSVFKFPETHPVERIRQFEANFSRSVARASHLITDSEATRQEVISFLGCSGERVTAVPLGVSSAFAPRPEESVAAILKKLGLAYGGYTLCVSTLEPRKKVGHLLRAYQLLPASLRQRFPLVVAGHRGWLSDELHLEMERCAAEGWFHYAGFVTEADLPLLFAGAGLFVFPSAYEGFGLPALEAMASGVPVVTSDRSSLPEVTQGAALLIDPDDIVALAGALEAGLCDDSWRAGARVAGLSVAKSYSWDKCIKETLGVYRHVLAPAVG